MTSADIIRYVPEGVLLSELCHFSSSNHNYSDMAVSVRESDYLRNIPPLAVECVEMDGDQATWPLIFEDFYVEWSQGKPGTTRIFGKADQLLCVVCETVFYGSVDLNQ